MVIPGIEPLLTAGDNNLLLAAKKYDSRYEK
jgi:hypothetical protein